MRYAVKLSVAERNALTSLIGQPLDRVACDEWAAELRSGATVLSIFPYEVATPDADHPYGDVPRPMIQIELDLAQHESLIVLSERLGLVREVNVVSTLIGFSPVRDCPPVEISPGAVIPASRGYGWVYFPPGQREQAEREVGDGALVDLDIAFELVCDRCPSLVVYARGFFVRVSLQGLPADADWVAFGTYARCRLDVDCRT